MGAPRRCPRARPHGRPAPARRAGVAAPRSARGRRRWGRAERPRLAQRDPARRRPGGGDCRPGPRGSGPGGGRHPAHRGGRQAGRRRRAAPLRWRRGLHPFAPDPGRAPGGPGRPADRSRAGRAAPGPRGGDSAAAAARWRPRACHEATDVPAPDGDVAGHGRRPGGGRAARGHPDRSADGRGAHAGMGPGRGAGRGGARGRDGVAAGAGAQRRRGGPRGDAADPTAVGAAHRPRLAGAAGGHLRPLVGADGHRAGVGRATREAHRPGGPRHAGPAGPGRRRARG